MAELSSAWWSKNKAKTLKATGLGGALREYETALAELKKLATSPINHRTIDSFDAAETLLTQALPRAVDAAVAECNKLLHKDTIEVLKEYRAKLVPKAAAQLINMRATYMQRYEALKRDWQTSSQALFEQSGKTLEAARAALDESKRLVGGIDADKMAMIEDLSRGGAGKADAEKRVQRIGKSVIEVGAQRTLAAQALAKAKADVQAKFVYKKDVLRDDQLKHIRDKIQGQLDAAEMSIEQIGEQARLAQESSIEALKLLKGQADLSNVYLKSAQRAADTAMLICDRLEGATRPLGGDFDGLNFSYLNAGEKLAKDKDRPAFLGEMKRIALGVAAKDKTCKDLGQQTTAALAEIARSLKTFPEFVRSDQDNFGRYFKTIDDAVDGLESAQAEAARTHEKLQKLVQKLKEASAG